MRRLLGVVSALLFVVGVVWFFQGIGEIGGSFMTSQTGWAIAGAGCVVVGAALVVWLRRSGQRAN